MHFFTRNYYLIIVISIGLVFFGFLTIPLQRIMLSPSQNGRYLIITTQWPCVDAYTMEAEVTSILEGMASNLPGIKRIESSSGGGTSKVICTVNRYSDINKLKLDLTYSIRQIIEELPREIAYPRVFAIHNLSDENTPVVEYAIYSKSGGNKLNKYIQEKLINRFKLIEGVDEVRFANPNSTSIFIRLNNNATSFDIGIEDIANTISSYCDNYSVGNSVVKANGSEYNFDVVFGSSRLGNIDQLGELPVRLVEGKIIRVADVAKIQYEPSKESSFFRVNGCNGKKITFFSDNTYSDVKLINNIKKIVYEIKEELPFDYDIIRIGNYTQGIVKELDAVMIRSLLTIVIVILFVFLISKDYKHVFIVIISLLANLLIAFGLYYVFNIEIHFYSLAGITISIGLIIDNAIVMTDHIINRGDLRIFTAVLASTLTTIASLSLIIYIDRELSYSLLDFTLVLVINLLVSLIVALFLIPSIVVLFKIVPNIKSFSKHRTIIKINTRFCIIIRQLARYRNLILFLLILIFGLPVSKLPLQINGDGFFSNLYNSTFGSNWYNTYLKPYTDRILGGSLMLFSDHVFIGEISNIPQDTTLVIKATLPYGTNISNLDNVLLSVELLLNKFSNSITYITNITTAHSGTIKVNFRDSAPSDFPLFLKNILVAHTLDIGGIDWRIHGVGRSYSNANGYSEINKYKIKVHGYNYNGVTEISDSLKNRLKLNPRVSNISTSGTPYQQLTTGNNRYLMKLNNDNSIYGITDQSLINEMSQKARYKEQLSVRIDKSIYDTYIIAADNYPDNWSLMNSSYESLPVKNLLTYTNTDQEILIWKENQNYIKVVEFQYNGTFRSGELFCNSIIKEFEGELPVGYEIMRKKPKTLMDQNTGGYILILVYVLVVVFFICSILFESLRYALLILAMVPASFVGIFLTFYVFDLKFDTGGYASFLLVSGLAVNSAIYLINEIINITSRTPEANKEKIVIKAINQKIIPILLTIVSTIFGLLPFVIIDKSKPFWTSLAAGTIGGLLVSLAILFFILPLFMINGKNDRITASTS